MQHGAITPSSRTHTRKGLTRRSFLGATTAVATGALASAAINEGCPICDMANSPLSALTAAERKKAFAQLAGDEVPELISTADDVWAMGDEHRLCTLGRAAWNLQREIIDATIRGGWENPEHYWDPVREPWYRYALAFGSYAIPSVAMVDNAEYANAVDTLAKEIMLMKEHLCWDDWVRNQYGDDPISTKNVMWKGHLNLMMGLYTLMTGSDQFEPEFKWLTNNIVTEYQANKRDYDIVGIECEPGLYFYPCNTISMMSLMVYDKVYGTDYEHEYCLPTADFLKEVMTVPDLHIPFLEWHVSHRCVDSYLFGDWWTFGMVKIFDPEYYRVGYENSKDMFLVDIKDGRACYSKASLQTDGLSTDLELRLWNYKVAFSAREWDDPDTWSKIQTFYHMKYELAVDDEGVLRFHDHVDEETMVAGYYTLGVVHQGWENILAYDWSALRAQLKA